jgi:hypothetical protein
VPVLECAAADPVQRTLDFGRGEGFGTNTPDSHTSAGTTLRASLYAATFSGFAARQRRVAPVWQFEHQDDNPSRACGLRRNSLFFFRCLQRLHVFTVFLTPFLAKT